MHIFRIDRSETGSQIKILNTKISDAEHEYRESRIVCSFLDFTHL